MLKKTGKTKKKGNESNRTLNTDIGRMSSFNDTASLPVACSSPSDNVRSVNEAQNHLSSLKEIFVRQAELEKKGLETMIDNYFDRIISILQRNNYVANAFVTVALFPSTCSLLDGMKNVIEEAKKQRTSTVSSSTNGIDSDVTQRRRSHSETRETSANERMATQKKPRSSSCDRFSRFVTPYRPRDESSSLKIANVTPLIRSGMNRTNILRKPMPGETAISLSGSPLLVTSDNVIAPSLTVPLNDGRVLNLQRGAAATEFRLPSHLDRNVMDSLRDIQQYLNKVLP